MKVTGKDHERLLRSCHWFQSYVPNYALGLLCQSIFLANQFMDSGFPVVSKFDQKALCINNVAGKEVGRVSRTASMAVRIAHDMQNCAIVPKLR